MKDSSRWRERNCDEDRKTAQWPPKSKSERIRGTLAWMRFFYEIMNFLFFMTSLRARTRSQREENILAICLFNKQVDKRMDRGVHVCICTHEMLLLSPRPSSLSSGLTSSSLSWWCSSPHDIPYWLAPFCHLVPAQISTS